MTCCNHDFKAACSMLMNLFGSDVPSDTLLLEKAQRMEIQNIYFDSLAPSWF
jgi:hypothetical protein